MTANDFTSVLYGVAALLTALATLIRASRKGQARLPRWNGEADANRNESQNPGPGQQSSDQTQPRITMAKIDTNGSGGL
jgi:hypothetical protein